MPTSYTKAKDLQNNIFLIRRINFHSIKDEIVENNEN